MVDIESKVWDVIIVGAGPAGLYAAIELADKASVLVLDRKQEIGCPKRCAEGLSQNWFNILGLTPNPEWAIQPIRGAALYSPNGKQVKMKNEKAQGFILERKMFEKHLAIAAVKKGAHIVMKHQVINAQRKNNEVEIKVEVHNSVKTIKGKLVIACDGIDSLVARMLGLNTKNNLNDTDSGYQYEMTGVSGYDENLLHLYFGNEVAPRGYCLTPESEVVAKNSVKPISEFMGGEDVLTMDGWAPVLATSEREYQGEVFDITPRMVNKKVGLTAEHEVYAWNKKIGFSWKKAKDLVPGSRAKRNKADYLVFPINKQKSVDYLLVSDYYKGIEKNGLIYPKGKNQFGAKFPYKHGIKNKIQLTNDLLYLMGFFVAEGNTNSGGIILSNTNKALIDNLNIIGKKEFGFDGSIWVQEREKNCYQLNFASRIIKEIFATLFGVGAANKKIPPLFFGLNDEQKKSFIKGYFHGDGCVEKSPTDGYNILSFTTISKHLANDLWILFASMKIVAYIGRIKQKNAYKIKVRGKQLTKLESVCGKVNFGKREQIHGYTIVDNNICLGIKDLTKREYTGRVYDIQTNGSFCVPFAVHNCWIFPKRDGTANVGIGIGAYVSQKTKLTAKDYLDRWIEKQSGLKDGSIIEVNAGGIPVGGFLDDMTSDNLLVAGDAGHMVDPIHGGGIGIAMEGGRLAAQVALRALKATDYSHKFLSTYNKEWYDLRGNSLKRRLKSRHLLEQLSDDDFNYLAGSITMDEALKIGNGTLTGADKIALFTKKLITKPKLLLIMKKYFS